LTSAGDRSELRVRALDAYLDERASAGYSVETRTQTQAIIVRTRGWRWLSRRGAGGRHVVSVDDNGLMTSLPAEPVRW
jgi:hypothetical protein